MFVAGILQAYVVEEWVHHSVHFYQFENLYFRYIKRHHLYHHSPRAWASLSASPTVSGTSSTTRGSLPDIRHALYAPLHGERPRRGPRLTWRRTGR